jgi:diadenosine tetraphosphate (Ap4A) HIT family hydrolase
MSFPETNPEECPFCQPAGNELVDHGPLALAIKDNYPSSPGHTLIVPRRHVPDFFALTPAEQQGIRDLLFRAQQRIDQELRPSGYNIGVNVGQAGGQTVGHVHIHLIPRFPGDSGASRPDGAKGGVRWVLPDSAPYWNNGSRAATGSKKS